MTIFDDLRKRYAASSAEQKLIILRRELLRPIVTVESSAHLLQTASDRICDCLPEEVSAEEFKNTVTWLTEAPSGKWNFSTNGIYWAGKAGIPSIGFGPGDEETAHTVRDSVSLEDMVKATEFYAILPSLIK